MNTRDLKSLMMNSLHHLYNNDEINAIVRFYLEDKLNLKIKESLSREEHTFSDLLIPEIKLDVKKLAEGYPLQYITGIQWFYNIPFKVSPEVLIPRPETEELVAHIVEEFKGKAPRILDIGTGSGCIAIALKRELPNAEVFATDVSTSALALAHENASIHKAKVDFIEDDILTTGIAKDEKYDLIVSNPPYIPQSESNQLHKNVREYEPPLALFSPNDDPYIFYTAIGTFARKHLSNKGVLYVEIHHLGGKEVSHIFKEQSLREINTFRDLSGNERFVRAEVISS